MEKPTSKPTLSEFNLSKESIDKLMQQKDKYNNACNEAQIKRNSKYKILVACYIAIMVIIVISMIIFIVDDLAEGNALFVCLCILNFIMLIGLFFLYCYKDSIADKFSPANPCKYSYVDKTIESNYEKYLSACNQYKDSCRKYDEYLKKCKQDFWINLSGYQFENEVANLYRQMGYNAQVTRKSADGGVDIILTKGRECIAVQCKHHKNKVGPNDVRALQGVVHNGDYTSGVFVSLNGFTPTVSSEVQLGKETIVLVSLDDLIEMQEST